MTKKTKMLYLKYRELLAYILVGGGTTIVAWGCKYLGNLFIFDGTPFPSIYQITVLSIVENIAAIAYAYPANRKWVFHCTGPYHLEELLKFTGSRAFVSVLGWLLNILLIRAVGINVFFSTVLAGIAGTSVNYILLKLLIFRPGNRREECPNAKTITLNATPAEEPEIASAA